jgi:hypothetical protein
MLVDTRQILIPALPTFGLTCRELPASGVREDSVIIPQPPGHATVDDVVTIGQMERGEARRLQEQLPNSCSKPMTPGGAMTRRNLICIFAAMMVLVHVRPSISSDTSGPARSAISMTVDAGMPSGPLPFLFRTGVFTFSTFPPKYVWEELLSRVKPGAVEIDLGREILANSRDRDDVLKQLVRLIPAMRKTEEGGGQVILSFSKIPRWLSSRPSDDSPAMPGDQTPVAVVSPPRDYNNWADLVGSIVEFVGKQGVNPYYKVGWEPDTRLWQGNEEEFFRLYRYGVLGARRVDRRVRIGGPGASSLGPFWRNDRNAEPMLKRFIAYCGRTSIPELDMSRLPLDFVSIHVFGGNPESTYQVAADNIRKWLAESGYREGTKLHVGEWSDTPEPSSPDREQPFIASFIVANLVAMDRAGFHMHSYTSLMEQHVREETEFGGGLGLFTKNFVVRPSLNAFWMVSSIGGSRLRLESTDRWVTGVAGKDGDRIGIVVTNHVPRPRALVRMFLERLMQRGYTLSDIGNAFPDKRIIEDVLRGGELPPRHGQPPNMASDVREIRNGIIDLSGKLSERGNGKVTVNLALRNISWLGSFTLKEYRIDSANGWSARGKGEIDAIIKNRTRNIPRELESVLDHILSNKDFSKSDKEAVKQFIRARDKRSFLNRLPGNQREKVLETYRLLEEERDARISAVSREINARPDVRMTIVAERKMAGTADLPLVLSLEPNAVIFLSLERRAF